MIRHDLESEVTGTVWKILLAPGSAVAAGEVIMILESMKMEIPVESPMDGTVAEILVAENEQVEEDQCLAVVTA